MEKLSNEEADVISKIELAVLKELLKNYKATLRRRLRYSLIVLTKGIPELASKIGEDLYAIYTDPIDRYLVASAIARSFITILISRAFGIDVKSVSLFITNMDELTLNYLYQLGVNEGLIQANEKEDSSTM